MATSKLEYKVNEIIGSLIAKEKYTFVDKNLLADVAHQMAHELDMRDMINYLPELQTISYGDAVKLLRDVTKPMWGVMAAKNFVDSL